jgi:hypothetical protein
MHKLIAALGLSTLLMGSAALPLAGGADAAMAYGGIGGDVLQHQLAPVEKAQFLFGGRNYCWYDTGWRGPGWYWCGYAGRSGLGWGGGYGWNGWRGGHRGGVHVGGWHGGVHFGGGHGGVHFGGGRRGHGGGGHRGHGGGHGGGHRGHGGGHGGGGKRR